MNYSTEQTIEVNSTSIAIEISLIFNDREYKEEQIDRVLAYLQNGDPTGRLKSRTMVEAQYTQTYFFSRKQDLEREGFRNLQQLEEEFQTNRTQLRHKSCPLDVKGLTHQQIKQQSWDWYQKQLQELEAQYHQRREAIAQAYAGVIHQCEERIQYARVEFDRG
jgi:hypothetical protein